MQARSKRRYQLDEFSFGESGKKLLVGTEFLTDAQDECEEGSRFVESVL